MPILWRGRVARGNDRLLTCVIALMLATIFPASAETIHVGMSGSYYPFLFVQQDELQGFKVDFMNAVVTERG